MMAATRMPKRRFAFARSVLALVLREMSSTYGRSAGGYVWAIAEPVAGIAVFTVVLSFIARTPPLGDNFPLFFATGILMFSFYQTTSAKVGAAIRYSKPLLAYPNVTYVDAIVARLLLNALTHFVIIILVCGGIILVYGLRPQMDYVAVGRALAMAFAFGAGVGLVNCYMMSRFATWQFIWAVANRPMFLISGVFFLVDPLPAGVRDLLMYNPVAHIISEMRAGFYDTYEAAYVSQSYVYLVSLVLGALGMLLLHRYHRILMDEGL